MRRDRVVIRHDDGRVAAVAPGAAAVFVRRSEGAWKVLDANAPKDAVLAAAEALGRTVDPSATRAKIVDELAGATTPTGTTPEADPQED